MTAAVKAATRIGSVGEVKTITATPLKIGVYTVTVENQSDWVILSDFTNVRYAMATIDASGAANNATISEADDVNNKVTLNSSTTGAVTILAIGQ